MIINRYAKGGGLSPRIVVSVTTGAMVTCSKGATTLTATSVDGKCSFNVNDYGVWTVSTDSDTQTVNVEYVQLYEVTLKYISGTLNDNDWATIRDVADRSEGANYWSVGDTKQITINGKLSDGLTLSNYQTWVYIIGFDHNSSVEGTGIAFQGFKTAQTSGADVALCDSGYDSGKPSGQWFQINNSNTTSGGWKSCNMRNITLPLVKSVLPSELTSVIKTMPIYTDNTGSYSSVASYVTATMDDLYLLAEWEIFGARANANTAEQNYQQQYAYYVAGNSKIKYRHDSTTTAVRWWARSPVAASPTRYFCCVYTNGGANIAGASYSLGFAPAFKVGSNPPVTIAETWLINATFGTLSEKTFNVSFVSNDTEYSQFWIGLRTGDYQIRYDDTLVFDADGAVWQNQAYRTIGLYEPASGDFLTWLNANAVKQS